MRQSPSIVPDSFDRDIYLVLDDFGDRLGWAWPETDVADTDRATVIRHLLEGQYSSPVRIVAFNPAEGRSRDVTDDIAAELAQRVLIAARRRCRSRTSSTTTPADWQFAVQIPIFSAWSRRLSSACRPNATRRPDTSAVH